MEAATRLHGETECSKETIPFTFGHIPLGVRIEFTLAPIELYADGFQVEFDANAQPKTTDGFGQGEVEV
ncbi:hypothetical protein AM10699_60270 (plasmid) [Acaryochloris marina MBIC10699]|nr:hypothetical protein AM10699_60270 [Acaryochloris marina MBIC10699]